MTNNDKDIKTLLDKFYQGISSENEERFLSDFFTGGNMIPPELEPDRQLFMALAKEPEAPASLPDKILEAIDKREKMRKWKIVTAVAAAAVLIGVIITISFHYGNGIETSSDSMAYSQEIISKDTLNEKPKAEITKAGDVSETTISPVKASTATMTEVTLAAAATATTKKHVGIKTLHEPEQPDAATGLDEEQQSALMKAFEALKKVRRIINAVDINIAKNDTKIAKADTKVEETYKEVNEIFNNINK